MLRPHELRADVLQQEASRSVGVFGLARGPAQLPEECCLLIAGNARNRHAAETRNGAQRRRHLAHALAGPYNFRQHAFGNLEELQQVLIPLALYNIEKKRARGVGHVCNVLVPAGKVPDQPTVYSAESKLAALGTRPRAVYVIQNPLHLGRGEIRIEHEAGLRRDALSGSAVFERLALCSSATILPHDRRMNCFSRCAFPHNHGLALVGNADGRHVARPRSHFAEGFYGAGKLAGQDLHRIVLDPSVCHKRRSPFRQPVKHAGRGSGKARELLIHGVWILLVHGLCSFT